MKAFTRTVILLFLFVEIVIFASVYCFGPQGLQTLFRIEQENIILEQEIKNLESEIAFVDKRIHAFEKHDFYKEKIAREQLQMARKGDIVYYVS